MIWLTLLRSKVARFAGVALTLAIFIATFGQAKRREGKKEMANDILKDKDARIEAGRDALREGRGGGTPADRLRANDGKW